MSPILMTAPLPRSFSIWERAAVMAASLFASCLVDSVATGVGVSVLVAMFLVEKLFGWFYFTLKKRGRQIWKG